MLYPAELRGLLAFDTPSTSTRLSSICVPNFRFRKRLLYPGEATGPAAVRASRAAFQGDTSGQQRMKRPTSPSVYLAMASRPNATSLRDELKNTALGIVDLSPSTGTSCGLAARTSDTVEFDVPKSSPQLKIFVRQWSGSSCAFSISKLFSWPSDGGRRFLGRIYRGEARCHPRRRRARLERRRTREPVRAAAAPRKPPPGLPNVRNRIALNFPFGLSSADILEPARCGMDLARSISAR
jgi:hypothetical protein